MKKLFVFILILIIASSCGKFRNKRIIVKGTISTSSLKSESTYTLKDAAKVLVFYGNLFEIEKIKDSKFQVKVDLGSASAMAFLTEDNKYIGNLVLDKIHFLPVVNLSNGEDTEIDLQDLVLDGTNVIPNHNPIGDEINVTTTEMACYAEISNYYKSLAKNIDTDSNGEIDVLEDKNLLVTTVFGLNCGYLGAKDQDPVILDTSDMRLQYVMAIAGNSKMTNADVQMSSITLTGPEGNPYPNIYCNHFAYNRKSNYFYTHFLLNNNASFEKGMYTFCPNGNDKYTFEYSSISAKNYQIIAKPILHGDSNNKLTTISVSYELLNGQAIRPENFIVETSILFSTEENQNSEPYQINKFNDDAIAISDETDIYTFTNEEFDVKIEDILYLKVVYKDLIGNLHESNYQIR